MIRAGLAGALLLTAAALSGCGSGGSGGSGPASSSTVAPPPATTSRTATQKRATHPPHDARHATPKPRRATPKGPPVGHGQQVNAGGSQLTVTITRVIDPLTHTGSRGLPGTRQVGVQLEIDNHGPSTYDSTASGDVSVALSTGQAAPLDVRAGPCETQLVDFESHVYSGDTREGCVGFTVPRGAKLLAARFSPYSHAAGTLTWRAR